MNYTLMQLFLILVLAVSIIIPTLYAIVITLFDAYGNLTRIYEKEGQMDYRFKWSQIEVTQ